MWTSGINGRGQRSRVDGWVHDVGGRRITLSIRSLGWLDQIWRHRSRGERVNPDVGAGGIEGVVHLKQLGGNGSPALVISGLHRCGVGLVMDAVRHRLDHRPRGHWARAHEVGRVVRATPLPG